MAQYFSAPDVRTHFDTSLELLSVPRARLIYQMFGMRAKFSVYSVALGHYDCHAGMTYILSLESYSILHTDVTGSIL